jgi:hypothetical protein
VGDAPPRALHSHWQAGPISNRWAFQERGGFNDGCYLGRGAGLIRVYHQLWLGTVTANHRWGTESEVF